MNVYKPPTTAGGWAIMVAWLAGHRRHHEPKVDSGGCGNTNDCAVGEPASARSGAGPLAHGVRGYSLRLAALAALAALAGGCATVHNGAGCWWATTVHQEQPAQLPGGPLCLESVGLQWQRHGLSCRLVAFPVVGQCSSVEVEATP